MFPFSICFFYRKSDIRRDIQINICLKGTISLKSLGKIENKYKSLDYSGNSLTVCPELTNR